MLQCLLMLNGLSVLLFEILFEEFYNKAIKESLWNQMEMQTFILLRLFCFALFGFWVLFKIHLERLLK